MHKTEYTNQVGGYFQAGKQPPSFHARSGKGGAPGKTVGIDRQNDGESASLVPDGIDLHSVRPTLLRGRKREWGENERADGPVSKHRTIGSVLMAFPMAASSCRSGPPRPFLRVSNDRPTHGGTGVRTLARIGMRGNGKKGITADLL